MVTFNVDKKLYAAAIHNDNGKDAGVCIFTICMYLCMYAKQKHPGCKKVRGQSEARL